MKGCQHLNFKSSYFPTPGLSTVKSVKATQWNASGKNIIWHQALMVSQRGRGCPIPGSVQGSTGWGPEQPDLMSGIPVPGRGAGTGWSWRCFPTQTILEYCNNHPVLPRLCALATKAQVTGAHHADPIKASIRSWVGMRINPGPIIKTIRYTS